MASYETILIDLVFTLFFLCKKIMLATDYGSCLKDNIVLS